MRELENNMVREPLNQPQPSNPQKDVLLMIIPNSTLKFSAPSAPEPSRCRCYHIFPTKYVLERRKFLYHYLSLDITCQRCEGRT